MSARLDLKKHLHEPERLARFVEVSCASHGDSCAVFGYALKLFFTHGVCFSAALCVAFGGVSRSVDAHCLAAYEDCFEERMSFGVVGVSGGEFTEFSLDTLDDSGKAVCEDIGIINGDMTDAVIVVVTGSKEVMLHGKLCGGGDICVGKLACGFAFPIFMNGRERTFCVFGYVKRVCLSRSYGIELLLKPLERELGEGLTASRRFCCGADDKLIGTDCYRDILENMTKRLCASKHDRLGLGLHIRLGDKHGLCLLLSRAFYCKDGL